MNSKKLAAIGALAVTAVSFAALEANAQPRFAWQPLGCRDVNLRVDRDSINVGARQGDFKAIRLKVRGAPVEMFDLKVVYGNGQVDDLPVRQVIPAGGETRAIDLRGRERFIRSINMTYRSVPTFRGHAAVCAEGLR